MACSNGTHFKDDQQSIEEDVQEDVDSGFEEESSKYCDGLALVDEGQFLTDAEDLEFSIPGCSDIYVPFAGAKSSLVQLSFTGDESETLEVRIENLLYEGLSDWVSLSEVTTLELLIQQSGEHFLHLRNWSAEQSDLTVQRECLEGCDIEYSRYPIVFLHGLAGFDTLLSTLDYWVGVEELLTNQGYLAHIDGVSAFDDTYTRAVMWQSHIQTLVDNGVGRRFNLIGHSQGGLDARYFASVLDDEERIASITTIATPHYGSAVADLFSSAIDLSPADGAVLDALVSGAAELFGTSGASLSNQLAQMSPDNMRDFNQSTPDVQGVQYFSWAGKSCRYLQWSCQSAMDGETVSSYFLLTHSYIEAIEGDNDGLVSVTSAQWGEYLGVLPADHIDQVGHRFDLSNQPFEAAEFYLSEAQRLSELGL
jgi:triacylglycerol esterase/lipase EstA (alpha/beta hydrolase family)